MLSAARKTLDAATPVPPTVRPIRRLLQSIAMFAGAVAAYWVLVP